MGRGAPSFGAMISLKDYPAPSRPGMLDGVLRLPFEMVLTESFAFVDRQTALDRMSLALRRLRAADDEALSLRDELAAAKDEVGGGPRGLRRAPPDSCWCKADTLEALDAGGGRGPGGARRDRRHRRARGHQSGARLLGPVPRQLRLHRPQGADLDRQLRQPGQLPQSSDRPGARTTTGASRSRCSRPPPSGPITSTSTPATSATSPSSARRGSGKTALLDLPAGPGRAASSPRIAYFDKDRGAEGFIRAIGGRYDVIAPGEPHRLQSAGAAGHRREPRLPGRVAGDACCRTDGAPLDAEDRAIIADAIDANFAQPPTPPPAALSARAVPRRERRPSAGDLAARLRPWCEAASTPGCSTTPRRRAGRETRASWAST